MKCAHFIVADELVLDHAPDLVHGNVVLLGDVLKLTGDHAEDPKEDDGLHAITGKIVDGRCVVEDMVDEFVVLQGEQNLIVPPGIACRSRIENRRDKRANVLYPTGLSMDHGNDGSVTPGGWGWRRAGGGGSGRP
jgi:hypothetical protein